MRSCFVLAAALIASACASSQSPPEAPRQASLEPPRQPPLEALWYARNDTESITSFVAHADRVSIVAPQIFVLDSMGDIRGAIDARVLAAARARRVKMVPLVMNPGFDQPSIHRVLNVAPIRARAVRALAALCRDQHLDGIQFDIENVHVSDRDHFTSFVRESTDSVHHAGCTISAAVVPRTGAAVGTTSYPKWMDENWRSAYDYRALADTLDFISYMTYAQHTGESTPGPVAGFPWMEASIRYVLSLGVPARKISLGIPAYSDYWFSTYDSRFGSRMRGDDVGYPAIMSILGKAGAELRWDDVQKAPYAMWEEHGVFEHAWIEDARAFSAKLALVRKYGLRGYSVWLLGSEDPRTWDVVGPVIK